MQHKEYDAIVIGSGFGGTMTAKKLVEAGFNVMMIERGDWLERGPHNWESENSLELTPCYDKSNPYRVIKGGNKKEMGVYAAVGGPSLFYGGVSFRFREEDFMSNEAITGDSQAGWPIQYNDLEGYYGEAEKILNISGQAGIDPTEPFRSRDFPQKPGKYAVISQKIKKSAEDLGLHPFRLPLAINYHDTTRSQCELCTSCDTFACAVEAKNDLATMVLKELVEKGMTLLPKTMAIHLQHDQRRISSIVCKRLDSGETFSLSAKTVILSGGAMASPHLLLSSKLEEVNPAGQHIGRYLMRHVNAIVFGIFPSTADKEKRFHKEVAILDYYLGDKDHPELGNKIGSLQQVPTPPAALVQNEVPGAFGRLISNGVKLLTGLLAIAEDQPRYDNQIKVDHSVKNAAGMAQPIVSHEYSKRDNQAVKMLCKKAKKIMMKTGAITTYTHHIRTFSHAVGTVRMGTDPETSPLDMNCKFRGLDNLYVVDASFMPTSAAVNPSLTIAANALRVGDNIIQQMMSHDKV